MHCMKVNLHNKEKKKSFAMTYGYRGTVLGGVQRLIPCPVFRIWIRSRIHRIHMFLDLLDPDPDPLVRGMDPAPDPAPDPDPSIIM
jgi:hypothetical protein